MILIYHKNNKLVDVVGCTYIKSSNHKLSELIVNIAVDHPNEILVWCNVAYKEQLNILEIESFFQQKNKLLSLAPFKNYFSDTVGYIDESIFINVNKEVRYPTWQMSSAVGALHASLFTAVKGKLIYDNNFDYFLNSLAKLLMPQGLFCYSEPKLLIGESQEIIQQASKFQLYKFVKQHYKFQWLFLLFFNELIYDHKLTLLPFIKSLFYKSKSKVVLDFENKLEISNLKTNEKNTIDVIIPTIGRKKYLYDVLCDLRKQTFLPKNVIIVEQNPEISSSSELDYLTNEEWPFTIKHTFTHQPGACNARNIALTKVESEWVFLADDDIRFAINFIEQVILEIEEKQVKAVSIACIQKELLQQPMQQIVQWNAFGSGCSFVKSKILKKCKFNMGYEFGFGEDADFGMQIRNLGIDILFLPFPIIKHLKAPIGGFRTKPKLLWSDALIQPKPSPTVILFNLRHKTKTQLKGYKTILFIKFYFIQTIKNPFRYYINFKKQWSCSLYWANQLKNNFSNEI